MSKAVIAILALAATTFMANAADGASKPKRVWSASFEDKGAESENIKRTVENSADHKAQDQIRLLKQCGAKKNSCLEVELRKPIYKADGAIEVNYNVNGEVDLGGYKGTRATLRYRFFVPDGTDFKRQGKLPGLSSWNGAFGGDARFAAIPDKWSVRLMWLNTGQDGPKPSMYQYDQRRAKGRSGEHNRGAMTITTGRWHDVAIYVELNDPGASNGRSELWLDKALVACRSGMTFRNTDAPEAKISRLAFHNYYGGPATRATEFPDNPTSMRFDDFAVFDGRATPATPNAAKCKTEYAPEYLVEKP
jgi:hypothetical protein